MRQSPSGHWRPDWIVPEPDPPPTVTIAWLTWHILWWWTGVQAAIRGDPPPAQDEIDWPGSAAAAVGRLQDLAVAWSDLLANLTDADLERPLAYPWPEPRPLRLALAWVNSELMKNIAEIGVIHHLFLVHIQER